MKMIDSRPLQIALCVLVLVDVAVVVAEILLDMHAIRSQSLSQPRPTLDSCTFLKKTSNA